MSVNVSGQQEDLEEQHGGVPHSRRATEKWKDHFGKHGLHGKDQQRTKENGGHKEGEHEAVSSSRESRVAFVIKRTRMRWAVDIGVDDRRSLAVYCLTKVRHGENPF